MTADLAVVGGGVIGSFVVHEALRAHPDWRILLLEGAGIGGGATAWSAGVSFPLAATPEHRVLVEASAARYGALHGSPAGPFLRPTRMIYVLGRDRLEGLEARIVGTTVRPVTTAERKRVAEMLPDVQLDRSEVMVTHDGQGFAVRARPVAEALLNAAAARTEIHVGQRVDGIGRHEDGYRLHTRHGVWTARRVVLACGPWDPPGLPSDLQGAPGARRKRIAALHARLPVRADDPLVYFVDDDLFLLPLAAGVALVSFHRDEWDTEPDSCDGRPSDADLHQGREALARRSPLSAASVVGGRAFCDLYTDHRLPVVTTAPDLPGLAAVRGGSGSGVRLAPGLAAEALRRTA